MSTPTEQHERLRAFVGSFRGEETLHASPSMPEAGTAIGRFSARMGLDGLFLITDYEEERDGAVILRGHGVYGWDPRRARHTMFWFDSMGGSPIVALGTFEGDTLTFESPRESRGATRYVYELHGPDAYSFAIRTSADGVAWTTLMEGRYARVP